MDLSHVLEEVCNLLSTGSCGMKEGSKGIIQEGILYILTKIQCFLMVACVTALDNAP